MATHSSILAWRIPWTEELGGLQSIRSRRVRHDWSLEGYSPLGPEESDMTERLSLHTYTIEEILILSLKRELKSISLF